MKKGFCYKAEFVGMLAFINNFFLMGVHIDKARPRCALLWP